MNKFLGVLSSVIRKIIATIVLFGGTFCFFVPNDVFTEFVIRHSIAIQSVVVITAVILLILMLEIFILLKPDEDD